MLQRIEKLKLMLIIIHSEAAFGVYNKLMSYKLKDDFKSFLIMF